jgi:hypothetical protein
MPNTHSDWGVDTPAFVKRDSDALAPLDWWKRPRSARREKGLYAVESLVGKNLFVSSRLTLPASDGNDRWKTSQVIWLTPEPAIIRPALLHERVKPLPPLGGRDLA